MMEDQTEPIPEPAFIQAAPQFRIETAGFTAEVSRENGQVSYTDHVVEIAKAEGATHQSGLAENEFYKEMAHEARFGKVVDGEFTGWRFCGTRVPEWAKVI